MDKSIWFKRKRFGYGWTPSSWEGWAVILSYIVSVLGLTAMLDENSSDKEALFLLLIPMAVLTGLLIRIASDHGESLRWQWGKQKKDNNDNKKHITWDKN